jgi:putative transposase
LFTSNLQTERLDEIRTATNGNFALGDESFRRQVSAALGRRAERGNPGRPSTSSAQNAGQLELLGVPKKNVACP